MSSYIGIYKCTHACFYYINIIIMERLEYFKKKFTCSIFYFFVLFPPPISSVTKEKTKHDDDTVQKPVKHG